MATPEHEPEIPAPSTRSSADEVRPVDAPTDPPVDSARARAYPRPNVPSVIPEDDEEPEDTVMNALRPLREMAAAAEGGTVPPPPRPPTISSPFLPPLGTLPPLGPSSWPAPPASGSVPSARVTLFEAPPAQASAPPAAGARAGPQGSDLVPVGLEACAAEVGVAVIETDAAGAVRALNAAAERLTGWSAAEAIGAPSKEVFRLAGADAEEAIAAAMGAAPPEHTALLERRDAQVVPIRHAIGRAPAGAEGRLIVFRDVSGELFLALQLARQARHDALTGLLNRRAMAERVEQAVAQSKADGSRHVLCYFDLDRFRLVNATCGHDAGDDLLQWVATRVHEFLGPNDSAGRIGGDEFALLLVGRDAREGERVARELMRRLLEFRFGWEDKTFTVGASFGLVCFGADMGRAADVLGAADHACRLAKENGRGRIQIYLEGDDQMAQGRRSIAWVAGLQRNLEEGRLRLFAQGIQPLSPGSRAGAHFEILVRLVGEDGRMQSPVGIIQAAEHSGMMDAIDRFVVRQAFRMIGALPQRAMARLDTCSINLSGVSLLREGLFDYIIQEMHKSKVPPAKICFEITETAALANLGEVLWLMQELGAMGCRFAIDDFGSGHASYGYIETLPVDYVKIDGLFVRDLPENALHRAIVESVHRIGCTLGIETVAESVETQAIADVLTSIGVNYAQGWLYGRPAPLVDVLAGLDRDA